MILSISVLIAIAGLYALCVGVLHATHLVFQSAAKVDVALVDQPLLVRILHAANNVAETVRKITLTSAYFAGTYALFELGRLVYSFA